MREKRILKKIRKSDLEDWRIDDREEPLHCCRCGNTNKNIQLWNSGEIVLCAECLILGLKLTR